MLKETLCTYWGFKLLKVAFLRNILLLSVAIAFSLPLYEAYFIHPSYRAMIIEQTEQEAVRYGNYLINTLALDHKQLQAGAIPSAVAREVGVLREDRQLIKLRFFSSTGEIVYSTEASEFGVVNKKDYFVNIVAKGNTFTKVVEKQDLTADGELAKIDIVETYVPIIGTAGFNGAIEVYYDVSSALASLNALRNRSNLMLITITLGLITAIVTTLRRAYASHHAQQQTESLLLETNRELEQRVIDRTRELENTNQNLKAEVEEHLTTTLELKKANQFSRTVINSMNDSVAIIDAESFKVVDCNSVFKENLKTDVTEIIGNTCYKLTHNLDVPCNVPDQDCPLVETVRSGRYVCYEHQHHNKHGEIGFVEVSTAPITDETGKVVQVVHVKRDITEKRQAADAIEQMAYFDALTGLPNRRLLLDRLKKTIAQAKRKQSKLALLYLDLDRFKEINDSRGHSCGDQILKAISGRLHTIVRESDTLARLGGDEFVFLLTDVETELDACVVAEKILSAIREPIRLGNCQIHMTTSIGISIFPEDGGSSDDLLKNADMAMYEAKSTGRNIYKFFSGKLNDQVQERHQLENRMHQALEEEDFLLVYQPQIDLNTMTVVGVEALARWQEPELGLISPDRFIPVAEESGLILPLGDWVLETACRQAKIWLDKGLKDLCVAVNISVRQFLQPDFATKIKEVLGATMLPANLLELELTESLLMQKGEVTIDVLRQLKKLGVRLSIDDFGTGYSSLSYLKNFPIDRIKIDQSFVQDINNSDNGRVIVETIIAMSEQMGLEVIAEGVETETQRDILLLRNCHLVQGYLYALPMLPAELNRFMHNWPPPVN